MVSMNQNSKIRTINPFVIYSLYLFTSIAAAMTWPVSTIYLTTQLGRTFFESGIILMIGSFVYLIFAWLGGLLFDNWKPYLSLMLALVISLVAMILMYLYNSWPVYPILLWVNNIGFGMTSTLLNSYAAVIGKQSARQFFSNMAIVMNVGVIVGTFVGTYLFGHFMIHGTMAFGVFIMLITVLVAVFGIDPRYKTEGEVKRLKTKFMKPSPLLWSIGLVLFVSYLSYQFWETVISPHMIKLGMTVEDYGWLWVFNGLTIVLFQNVITKLTSKWSYYKSTVVGILIFALSFPPLIWANQYWQYIVIFEILTLGEMLFTPTITAWQATLGPESQRGQVMAFNSAAISLGRAIGPVYAGLFMDHNQTFALFASVFVIMIITLIILSIFRNRDTN